MPGGLFGLDVSIPDGDAVDRVFPAVCGDALLGAWNLVMLSQIAL